MRRLGSIAAAWSIAASAGCFYVEPINQRPALDIRPTSSDSVFRGATITLEAVANDPEGQVVAFQWRAYACTDALSVQGCDLDPIFTGIEPEARFLVPLFRADPDGDGPAAAPLVESLRVVLEGHDDHGAAAKQGDELIIPVSNGPPVISLAMSSAHGAVVTTPIDVLARYGDSDDLPQHVTLDWTVFSPSQVPGTLVELPPPSDADPAYLQQGRRFTPQVSGNWEVYVTATDRLGAAVRDHLTITVAPDGPPCLDSWSPAASAQPAPITEPTLFQVLHVRDDLDAYPRTSSETFVGETEFTWSIKVGAGPRQAVAGSINALILDPQTYAPGTVVELRVEIEDRNHTPITCADGAQTCSVISQPGCIQRQTWTLEAR